MLLVSISSLAFFVLTVQEKGILSKKIFYLIAFGLSSFSLIKTIPDGGLFLPNSLPILAAFVYGISDDKTKYKKATRLCFGIIGVYVAWVAIAWSIDLFREFYQLREYLLSGAIPFAVIMILFWLEKHANSRKKYAIGIILILLFISYPTYKEMSNLLNYMNIRARDGIVALYENPENVAGNIFGPPESSLGQLDFYVINRKLLSVGDIIRRYGLLNNIYPVAVPWKTCIPTTFGDSYSFSLNTTSARLENNVMPKQFNRADIKFVEEINGMLKYDISIVIKPCFPRHLNVIQEYLKSQFSQPFFVYNIDKLE